MKTYILKRPVYNNIDFPIGTIVKITDDYWGGRGDLNTGFTVVQGKLKGKKGCVADGLNGWLLDNTVPNRRLLKKFQEQIKMLRDGSKDIQKKLNAMPTVKLK